MIILFTISYFLRSVYTFGIGSGYYKPKKENPGKAWV